MNGTVEKLKAELKEAREDKLKLQAVRVESQLHVQGQAVMTAKNSVAAPFTALDSAQQCHDSYQEAQATLKALQQRIQECSGPEVQIVLTCTCLTRYV